MNYVLFLALGLSLSPVAAVFLTVILRIGSAPPSLPGKVGLVQYLVTLRALPREGGAVQVVVVAPPGEKALFVGRSGRRVSVRDQVESDRAARRIRHWFLPRA